jgi:DNA-binding NarL/FixJ family response regulator
MMGAQMSIHMKVLIAEDTDSVQFALRLALEYLGHEVVGFASDGLEVIEKCRSTQPELILMDVRMPFRDGLTCTAMLAKSDPAAKVLIVTGSRTTETEARQAGACGFLEKPFNVSDLDRAIHGALATA